MKEWLKGRNGYTIYEKESVEFDWVEYIEQDRKYQDEYTTFSNRFHSFRSAE
jgi:hypothetical protein